MATKSKTANPLAGFSAEQIAALVAAAAASESGGKAQKTASSKGRKGSAKTKRVAEPTEMECSGGKVKFTNVGSRWPITIYAAQILVLNEHWEEAVAYATKLLQSDKIDERGMALLEANDLVD